MTATTPSCGACRFYQKLAATSGECRFTVPQLLVNAENPRPFSVWPPVQASMWCGNFATGTQAASSPRAPSDGEGSDF